MDLAPRKHRTPRRKIAFVATIALLAGTLALLLPPASAQTKPLCRVKNMATLLVYKGSGSNLQVAIDEADPGVRLRLKGVCFGSFDIDHDLGLVGRTSLAYPAQATLYGNAPEGSVLTTRRGVAVSLRALTITHGTNGDASGGGIRNYGGGTLSLKGSALVTGNTAGNAGGIFGGTIILNASSSVSGNTGFFGGGIVGGSVILNGSSSVSGNTAAYGGGVATFGGTVTLNDTSSVNANTSTVSGGGIYNEDGTVTLNDTSSVNGNTADIDDSFGGQGGGIWNSCSGTLNNAIDGGNVNDNYRGTAAPVEDNIANQTPC